MKPILLTVVKSLLLIFALSACAIVQNDQPYQIALLAPFEGRYREVGYDALYSARLALAESGLENIELLALDDGGQVDVARERASALASNDRVIATMVLGYPATVSSTQNAFSDLPVIIAGYWGTSPQGGVTFAYTSAEIVDLLTLDSRIDITDTFSITGNMGGDVLAMRQFSTIHQNPDGIRIATSANLPDDAFIERYRASDQFAPEPQLISVISYDAMTYLLGELAILFDTGVHTTRETIAQSLADDFTDGFFTTAPLYIYEYDSDGNLARVDNIIEEW